MLSVRAATLDDADPIAAVHVKTWQAAYEGVMPQAHLDGLDPGASAAMWRRAIQRGSAPGAIFIADVVGGAAGALAGFIAVGSYRLPDGTQEPGVGEVFAIYVAPDHWSTGAGLALMRAGVDHLAAQGLTEIRLWVVDDNPRARRFYERFGYVADGTTRVDEAGGEPLDEVRYTLHVR